MRHRLFETVFFAFFNMRISILAIILYGSSLAALAQPTIKASKYTVAPNTNVSVEVRLDDFSDMLGTQYSVNWDASIISFVNLGAIRSPAGMNRSVFDLSRVDEGILTVDWTTSTVPQTIQDNSLSYEIIFRTNTDAGGLSSNIDFTNDPVEISFIRQNAGDIGAYIFKKSGRVSVIAPPCRTSDSTTLRQFYDNTDGVNWFMSWDVGRPINYWDGVILDAQGCLNAIDLDGQADGINENQSGRNLSGNLSTISNPSLRRLYLSGNHLTGAIPSFDALPLLSELSLDDNDFEEMTTLAPLNALQLLNVAGNRLSFDDILPQVNRFPTFIYAPQQEILTPVTINLMPNDSYTIDLQIDANISDNQYEWFKDGMPYQTITGVNQLGLNSVQLSDGGVYSCRITNPNAPDLTLQSAPITIVIDCPVLVTDLDVSICQGSNYKVGNVTHEVSGYYEIPLQSVMGCDSLVRLDLEVTPALTNTVVTESCGDSYVLGTQTYTESGNYEYTFTTSTGCDSTVFLQLTLYPNRTQNLNIQRCAGETYEAGGQIYDASGNYVVMTNTVDGCDSTIYLSLEILDPIEVQLSEQVCAGEGFSVGGNIYSETGTYNAILQNAMGCDSTVVLDLVVDPPIETVLDAQICAGDAYRIDDQVFTMTGNYEVALQAVNGCDSLISLDLVVAETYDTMLVATICNGESYTVGDITYQKTGFYQQILSSVNACDSIVRLDLTVQSDQPQLITTQICAGESYEVGTQTFATTGVYDINLLSEAGCDSLVRLDLTVNELSSTELNEQICTGMSYQIGTETFAATGRYEVVMPNAMGCDSTIVLDLLVVDFVESYIDETICEGESFLFANQDYDKTGQYQATFTTQNGCDSIVYLDLKVADEATLGAAMATENTGTCDNWTALFAEAPTGTVGTWTNLEDLPLIPTLDGLMIAENLKPGDNYFVYALATEDCPTFSSDTVVVTYTNPVFEVVNDNFKIEYGTNGKVIDL
ncbi:MAG: hypothetical protein AAGK47_03140, partial [Bacteroidota bacterium]